MELLFKVNEAMHDIYGLSKYKVETLYESKLISSLEQITTNCN